jgi:aldose 1-epimerase
MMSKDPPAAEGERLLRHGDYEAVVTPVAAGVRVLRHRGRDLIVPYEAGAVRPYYRGATLAPWPNRVVDGRYSFDGQALQLALTEPERGHALHGLVAWTRFTPGQADSSSASWAHRIEAQTGYPFLVEVTVRHSLGDDGLTWSVTGRNVGDRAAPWGTAPHPYLCVGTGHVDDWQLELPAERVLDVTPDRLVPLDLRPVEGTDFDFRKPRRIGGTEMDHAFTGLLADATGEAAVRLRSSSGAGVQCRWDPRTLPWLQIHTADVTSSPANRVGLATEPMTCPPDAFNSGTDLVVLAPGATHTVAWTISAL